MLSSKDLLDKTGISRATLNNYINLGILSKPKVSNPGLEGKGPRQLGFFPDDSIARIEAINQLKQEGYSMSEIVERLRTTPDSAFTDNTVPPAIDTDRRGTAAASPPRSDAWIRVRHG